jgi:hypothetical protein
VPALVTRVTAPQRFTCFAVTAPSSPAVPFLLTWAVAIWRPFFTDRHGVIYKSKPSLWVPVTPSPSPPSSLILAFTNLANRTVINSTIASTSQL